jgi:hypothetical protein
MIKRFVARQIILWHRLLRRTLVRSAYMAA